MINYSDNPLLKIKEVSRFFYKLYISSIFITYAGFIVVSWYFVNLAYTINIPSYDILCLGCPLLTHLTIVLLIAFWLFFLYFYIMNEVRFRFVHYSGRKQESLIKRNNLFFILSALVLTFATLYITL